MHKASKDPSEKTVIAHCGLIWALFLLLSGCGYYSFSGATVPEHIGTIAIPQVEDNSISTFAGLDEQMTQLLIQRFVRQTRLSLEPSDDNADALLQVEITRYVNAPTSVSGDERATRNRVTITVNVLGMMLLGRLGAAFATAASYAVMGFALWVLAKKKVGIDASIVYALGRKRPV